MWGEPWMRLWRPKGRLGAASIRSGLSLFLPSSHFLTSSRAPEGKHTAWGYCHVPNGSSVDMMDRIEAQIERFAPGFGDRILGAPHPTIQSIWRPTTPTTSAEISTLGSQTFGRSSRGHCPGCPPIRHRLEIYTSAPPPHHRAAGCTACVVTMRLGWR